MPDPGSVTLPRPPWSLAPVDVRRDLEDGLEQTQALNRFLQDVEKRAFRIAQIAVRDADEALDLVQDAMLQLARSYAARPSAEWAPLFYRILNNRIRDWQRRRKVRSRVLAFWSGRDGEDETDDAVSAAPDPGFGPSEQLESEEALAVLSRALEALPDTQREAFLLRSFEGLDVAATATAMGCSTGSVKTHYFRAVQALREELGEAWGT